MVVLYNGEPVTVPDSEYLAHHGVLGMKWGVRRYQNKDGTLTAEGKRREKAERKAEAREEREARKTEAQKHSESQKRLDVKNRGALTNQELQERIQRIRLEKELRTLTEEELSPGRAMMRRAIESSGQQLLTTAMTGAARFALMKVAGNTEGTTSEFLKALATGNVQAPKSNLDKLRDQVNTLTLKKRYDELTKDSGSKTGSSSGTETKEAPKSEKTTKADTGSSASSSSKGSSGSNKTGSAPYSNVNSRSNANKRTTVDATGADYEIFGKGSSSKSSGNTSSKTKQKVYNVKDWKIVDDEPATPSTTPSRTSLPPIESRYMLPEPTKKKKK